MAVDKRLPAVYVDIEDRSYVSEPIEAGRTAYVVIISDRGPHNQVVELNSQQDLYDLFGQPNFVRFGHGHYLANQHLKRSGKIFVVRPVILEPMEGMGKNDCASIANRCIKLNSGSNVVKKVDYNFIAVQGTNILEESDISGTTDKCPAATIKLGSAKFVAIQEGIDYIEYAVGLQQPKQIVLTNSVLTAAKTLSGWSDPTNHDITMKFNPVSGVFYCELVDDPSKFISCATTPFVYCKFVRPYDTTSLGETNTNVKINAAQTWIEFEDITPDVITIGDKIENIKANIMGTISPSISITPDTLEITSANIDQIKTAVGYDWVTNGCHVNVNVANGHLSLQILNPSGTSPVPCFQHTSLSLSTDKVGYLNYIPDEVMATISPYIPSLPGMTPGNISSFNVGDVIFDASQNPETAEKYTIISIDKDTKQAILDHAITTTIAGPVSKYVEIDLTYIPKMTSVKNIDTLDENILWNFYTIGAGKYYNNIFIKGVRNATYDRMYTDDDGNVQYPYTFMDIAIYRDNGDNTTTLLEGPWTISLIEKTSQDVIVRDIYTGLQLYLPVVINRKSKIIRVEESRAVDGLVTPKVLQPYEPDTKKRILIQNLISGKLEEHKDGIRMTDGSDGNMFDSLGRLNLNDNIKAIVAQAYNGSLKSEDGSIEKLLSVVYPWYLLNYIYVGGWDHNVNYAAKELADIRGDCLLLSDTGAYLESHTEEIEARRSLVPWNTWNAALYTNYRKIFDIYTSKYFWITPVYHAIDRHLYVDDMYWIAEPVAGIEKGAIEEAITLAYSTNETQLADELDVELNPVIIEPDGTYLLQQFTTWKRLSIMKRQHVVKFVHFCKQQLPKILKDILHRKATNYWLTQARGRVNSFMNKFLDKGDTDRYAAINSYQAQVSFDEEASELNVLLTIHPIRSIERINVNIIVT